MIVFLLSGLWHGANWTFVVWGSIHGALVNLLPGKRHEQQNRIKTIALVIINFLLVTLCWVFFRAANIREAGSYLWRIFSCSGGRTKFGLNNTELLFSVFLIAVLLVKENRYSGHFIKNNWLFAGWFVLMVSVCYLFGVFGENQFIYFQF